jgi:alpha-amylase
MAPMKIKRTVLTILFLVFFTTACAGKAKPIAVQPVVGLPAGTDGMPWWNDSVFYEIFVRSFYDSDGDGIGDFNGITAKLDYLNDGDPKTTTDLGVSGLWLMPINPSPSYHGYDVTDYYAVNPQYGSMDDFKNLLSEAHQRGIRVIIDMVMNHTSNWHPWFDEAEDPNSAKRNWYIWSENNPKYKGPWGEDVWFTANGAYYYAVFGANMPDLNYTNPDVRTQMEDVARFWLQDVGVDGFRLDAAKHIVEEGQTQENTPSTHAWWKEFRTAFKAANPEALMVGEVWSSSDAMAAYLQGDQLDMAFNFDLADLLVKNVKSGFVSGLSGALKNSTVAFPNGQVGTFLTNHDQNRVLYELGGDVDKAKNAATILLTTPGVPFVYYGEEIGMTGFKPDERLRTPMQWTPGDHAGFTTGSPWEDPSMSYAEATVADETADPNSLLALYRSLIQLRNQHAALRVGSLTLVSSHSSKVLAYLRQSQEETVLVLINLDNNPQADYGLSLSAGSLSGKYNVFSLLDDSKFTAPTITDAGGIKDYLPLPELPANARIILQFQKK